MPISSEQEDHACRLRDAQVDPDAFDAIIIGAEAMRDYPGSFASHERHSNGLTYALAVAKLGTNEEVKAFHEKGGMFTDQRDNLGRTAEHILTELVNEAQKARDDIDYRKEIGLEKLSDSGLDETIYYRRLTLDAYFLAVELQGGIIHLDTEPPSRNEPQNPTHQSVLRS